MLLKFLAKPEHLQPWPNSHHGGQPRRYIGWQWLPPAGEKQGARYEPKKDGDVVDEAAAYVDEIKQACSRGSLIAGDEATARACGIDFAEHTFTEAGFLPAAAAPKPGAKPAKDSKSSAPKEE